jgi:hypothetical protein
MQGRAARSTPLPSPADFDPAEERRVDPAPDNADSACAELVPAPLLPHPNRNRALAQLIGLLWRGLVLGILVAVAGGIVMALLEPEGGASGKPGWHLIDLRRFGDGSAYLTRGWSNPERAGSATTGLLSELNLPVESAAPAGRLILAAEPRFAPGEEEFWVDLLIDGTAQTRWLFRADHPGQRWLEVPLSGQKAAESQDIALVVGSRDPSEAGAGLMIESIGLMPAPPAPVAFP